MEDRVTIRLSEPLRKSLTGYCSATGRSQSDAVRHILEKGLDKIRTRYTWAEERRDLAKLFRPVLAHFEDVSREYLDRTAKRIEDELHIAIAGVRDDLTPLVEAQKNLLNCIAELEQRVIDAARIDPKLATTISEIRGFTYALVDNLRAKDRGYSKPVKDVEAVAIESARLTGARFGVEAFPPQKADG